MKTALISPLVLSPGQTIPLQIDKPAAGGRMIARADGQVVLVAGAIPGERVAVRIERVGKGVAYGQAVSIEEASADRREPFNDPLCGGCLYAHIAYPRQTAIKSQVIADALGRIGRIVWASPIVVAPSPEEGYRMRARLHVRDGRIGFFREGSHDLCNARLTRQLLPATSDVLDRIGAALSGLNPAADGDLDVSESLEAFQRVVHFETSASIAPETLANASGTGLTGVSVSRLSGGGRSTAPVVAGEPYVTDVLSIGGHDIVIRRHVLSFFQGNRFLLRDLVAHVVGQISMGDDVVDLYAGAGLFAIGGAVVRGARVTAVEGDSLAAADLTSNAGDLEGSVEAVHEPVEAFAERRRRPPDVLIVDPPRTGMSKEAVRGAIRLSARRMIYVSCDVATLARDARAFLDAGYLVERIEAFDLFPNTPHVETVVVLAKVGRADGQDGQDRQDR